MIITSQLAVTAYLRYGFRDGILDTLIPGEEYEWVVLVRIPVQAEEINRNVPRTLDHLVLNYDVKTDVLGHARNGYSNTDKPVPLEGCAASFYDNPTVWLTRAFDPIRRTSGSVEDESGNTQELFNKHTSICQKAYNAKMPQEMREVKFIYGNPALYDVHIIGDDGNMLGDNAKNLRAFIAGKNGYSYTREWETMPIWPICYRWSDVDTFVSGNGQEDKITRIWRCVLNSVYVICGCLDKESRLSGEVRNFTDVTSLVRKTPYCANDPSSTLCPYNSPIMVGIVAAFEPERILKSTLPVSVDLSLTTCGTMRRVLNVIKILAHKEQFVTSLSYALAGCDNPYYIRLLESLPLRLALYTVSNFPLKVDKFPKRSDAAKYYAETIDKINFATGTRWCIDTLTEVYNHLLSTWCTSIATAVCGEMSRAPNGDTTLVAGRAGLMTDFTSLLKGRTPEYISRGFIDSMLSGHPGGTSCEAILWPSFNETTNHSLATVIAILLDLIETLHRVPVHTDAKDNWAPRIKLRDILVKRLDTIVQSPGFKSSARTDSRGISSPTSGASSFLQAIWVDTSYDNKEFGGTGETTITCDAMLDLASTTYDLVSRTTLEWYDRDIARMLDIADFTATQIPFKFSGNSTADLIRIHKVQALVSAKLKSLN